MHFTRRTVLGTAALATALSMLGAIPANALSTTSARVCADPHGRLVSWGFSDRGERDVPANLTDVRQVVAGRWHGVALRCDGTVASWGANDEGQSDTPEGLKDVVDIAAGMDFSVALRDNGSVVAWGMLNEGETFDDVSVPEGLGPVRDIAANDRHVVALMRDGSVRAWGRHDTGQIDVPAGLKDVVAVGAGPLTSTALLADGTAIVWGYDPRIARAIPVAVDLNRVGETDTVRVGNAVGQSQWNLASAAGAHGRFAQIDAGITHLIGMRPDGSAYFTDRDSQAEPWAHEGEVTALKRVTAVDADILQAVILADGVVYDWRPSGLRRMDVRNAFAVSAGDGYGLAIVR